MEEELKNETIKWLERAEKKRENLAILDKSKEDMIKNIDAYISDSMNFLEQKKYILAFEAVIWAWSWMEILEEFGIIKT